jgi:POT family proton-dependent oligopeptide transporter
MSIQSEVGKNQPTFFGHPIGLAILFFTEMWERFSYYGMRGLLVLFLIAQVDGGGIDAGYGWTRDEALLLYGIYTALVYIMSIPGGIIADRLLGQKKSVMLGGGLLVIGQFMLAFHSQALFFSGLGLIILGVGLLKPNISTMVGGLYRDGDVRRDAGFTIFYMGINLGAFLAGIIVSLVAASYGWHWGFTLAGFGMLLGQGVFIWGQKYLTHVGNIESKSERKQRIKDNGNTKFTKEEWDRIIVLCISFLIVIVFWTAFEQAGGLMNIYTDLITDRTVGSMEVPAAVFQSLNAGYIMLFGGVVAALWLFLSRKGIKLSAISKMAIGTIVMGLGYLFMVMASQEAEYERVGEAIVVAKKSGIHWLLFAYLFHTLGELALSPVALSFITKVAPKKIVASMMGVYFAATGLANFLASWIGRQAEDLGETAVFGGLVIFTVSLGLLLILFSKRLSKMTHGTEDDTDEPNPHGEVVESA